MRIRTMVVEDEPLAREGLLSYIARVDFLEVVSVCEDALQANQVLAAEKIDLMFLDVQMPGITGIDLLKTLKNPPIVILTTAYPNFALQGYEMEVLDYLVKPFPFERFLKAANRAHEFFELMNRPSHPQPQMEDYFFVKCDNRYEKVCYADILYVEGMENYVIIHTTTQRLMTLLRMKTMEELLPASFFMRIHKSYIVSLQAITALDGNEVVVAGRRLPVSREKKGEMLSKVIKN